MYGFDIHSQDPHTIRLPVHLEDQQNVLYNDQQQVNQILQKNHDTQLTSYLKLCATDPEVAELLYYQMPLKFVWNRKKKQWTKRKR